MKVKDVVRFMSPFDEAILYVSKGLILDEIYRGRVSSMNDCYLDSEIKLVVPLEECMCLYLGLVVE